jgi:hypothetical protein
MLDIDSIHFPPYTSVYLNGSGTSGTYASETT